MSNKYYEQILNTKGAEDFITIVKKWQKLSENLESDNFIPPVILPDILLIAKSGVGKTFFLNRLSHYLSKQGNLVEFCGDVKFFEFQLDYCSPMSEFSEISRLMAEVENASGFHNQYKGIVSIDIEEWLGHHEEKHFISFMEYLSANSAEWLIIFNVTGENATEVDKLESILSMYFRIEKATLNLPDTKYLIEYMDNRFAHYELTLSKGAKEVLFETVEKLRTNKYFDGYKTINMLVEDVIYAIFSNKTRSQLKGVIDKKDVLSFSVDSQYVKRAFVKMNLRVGF